MRKFMERYRIWKEWTKVNTDGKIHHVLVLFGLRKSPTFELYIPMKQLAKDINVAFSHMSYAMDKFEKAAKEVFKNEP